MNLHSGVSSQRKESLFHEPLTHAGPPVVGRALRCAPPELNWTLLISNDLRTSGYGPIACAKAKTGSP
ncbi:hypothetical protein SBV1_190044 [Verrucomicrobia bacterium]|nr:hypothetical protein SBV1_190044 [Verrucomicrobiota bacterium]